MKRHPTRLFFQIKTRSGLNRSLQYFLCFFRHPINVQILVTLDEQSLRQTNLIHLIIINLNVPLLYRFTSWIQMRRLEVESVQVLRFKGLMFFELFPCEVHGRAEQPVRLFSNLVYLFGVALFSFSLGLRLLRVAVSKELVFGILLLWFLYIANHI